MSVTAIIPAYNEAATIGRVLEVLLQVSKVDEILVVDDGSRDDTAATARRYGVEVLRLPRNRGKGAAMTAGARRARGETLIFLDADLEGLTPEHVTALLEPVLLGEADMTVGIFKSGRGVTDAAQMVAPFISGQRALGRELFLAAGADAARFEVEVLLTRFVRSRGLRIRRVPLWNMTHAMKEEKRGLPRGVVERLGMYKDITLYFCKRGRRSRAMQPAFLILVLLLGVSLIGYNLFYLKNIRAARAEVSRLVRLDTWGQPQRILVISPHPDDETLAAGGFIARSVREGSRVRVVFLTSGDGFKRGLELYRRRLNPSPAEFLAYGEQRMAESEKALGRLGVKPDDIIWLGYPDGGLGQIWERGQSPESPYFSRRTRRNAVPYRQALSPGAPYTAPQVLKDLTRVLDDFKPTVVLLPDPEDSHPDHWATSVFSLTALVGWEQENPERHPRLLSYLVHAGLWQVVPKVERGTFLLPPRNYLQRGTTWYTLDLTPTELRQKKEAMNGYTSQARVIFTFMNNFLRPNEIFSQVRVSDLKLSREDKEGGFGSKGWRPGWLEGVS